MALQLSRSNWGAKKKGAFSLQPFLLAAVWGFFCFYVGCLVGGTFTSPSSQPSEAAIRERIAQEVRKVTDTMARGGAGGGAGSFDDTAQRFPAAVSSMAVGMGRVQRDSFAQKFGMGIPLDPSTLSNNEVLMLYSTSEALPGDPFAAKEAVSQTTMPLMDVDDATSNCDYMNVVLTDFSSQRKQCIAILGNYEAFHLQKYMRLPDEGKLDSTVPLRFVNRGAQASGRKSQKLPSPEDTQQYWEILTNYIHSLPNVLEKLRPIASKVAVENTVIVSVCNFGQLDLLVNFICASRARGHDLSSILVFATDVETRDKVQALGLAVFYDEDAYGDMPKEAAKRYADKTFTKMMMAKVFCVQQIMMLGYDVLFQDVDLIWYKDPLEYFHDPNNADFDVYFQDDGNHALFYAPYSANTGFYYVRHNEKTLHFFNSFLMAGDMILSTHSHQIPLVAMLAEHASMYGMKVKIFPRTEDEFPGGFHFHRRKDFMKDLISGAVEPYIFHMSWTSNKDNKILFYRQLGEWYTHDQCIGKSVQDVLGTAQDTSGLAAQCCSAEPIVSCHYRDKPSKNSCKDSPPIDKGRPSFW